MNSPMLCIRGSNFHFRYVKLCDLDIPREKWFNYLQTVDTLIRCHFLRHLIWVCSLPITLLGVSRLQWDNIAFYTPDIRSMWGYIVFAFPFIRSFIRTYVCSFVRSFVRSSFRHRVKVFALKFIRPHILKTL